MSVSTARMHIPIHHINNIHTCSMLASNTHASHQQPSLLLICFCYQQLQTNTGKRSQAGSWQSSQAGTFCVQLCIETLCKRATSKAHLTNFLLNFFMKFSQKMPLYFFYTMAQKKSNMTKNSTWIKGSCLNREVSLHVVWPWTSFVVQTPLFIGFGGSVVRCCFSKNGLANGRLFQHKRAAVSVHFTIGIPRSRGGFMVS